MKYLSVFEAASLVASSWRAASECAVQQRSEVMAGAFLISETFLAGESAALALGDNLFRGATWASLT